MNASSPTGRWINDHSQFREQWCISSREDTDVLTQRFHHRRCWVHLWRGGRLYSIRLWWHFESQHAGILFPLKQNCIKWDYWFKSEIFHCEISGQNTSLGRAQNGIFLSIGFTMGGWYIHFTWKEVPTPFGAVQLEKVQHMYAAASSCLLLQRPRASHSLQWLIGWEDVNVLFRTALSTQYSMFNDRPAQKWLKGSQNMWNVLDR